MIFLRLFMFISFFFFNLFGVYKKHLPLQHNYTRQSIKKNNKDNLVMNLHTSINLAVLHIIRVVVVASRA